jgi:hypothetical protein
MGESGGKLLPALRSFVSKFVTGMAFSMPYFEAMRQSLKPTAPTPKLQPELQELAIADAPDTAQMENIKSHIDLVLIALETLTGISTSAMLRAAAELKIESMVSDRVALWRLRQSNPLRKGEGGRKRLDVEEARGLVLICCYLAKEQQELIRRAVALLEQLSEQNRQPHEAALLGDYIDNFCNMYQERMEEGENVSPDTLSQLALKLMIDLLFYSGPSGSRRLWLALLDRAR